MLGLSVRDLAGAYLPKGEGWMTLVTAYCDASGTTAPTKVFTLAGWIGEVEAWTEVEERWAEALPPGVAAFHMREFAHSVGQFEGWSEERRQKLMGRLLDILCNSRLIGSVAF